MNYTMQILALFGLTAIRTTRSGWSYEIKLSLPKDGDLTLRRFGRFDVWIRPSTPAVKNGSRSTHRLIAHCTHCGQTLSAGRIRQHVCK